MKISSLFAIPLVASHLAAAALAQTPSATAPADYRNDLEQAEPDKLPGEFMVLAGGFTVKSEAGNRFIELPGAPLDTFGLLFGQAKSPDCSASARFYGTKQGRKFPTFGLSLGGVGGYRLQVSPGKKALEIYKGDEPKASTPLDWQSGTWTVLRIELRKAASGKGAVVQGKAWPDGQPEPAEWMLKFEAPEDAPNGRAAVWGSPYSGTPIRFDDLRVEGAPASR